MVVLTLQQSSNPSPTVWVPLSMDVILGILESDGSFQVKTYCGTKGLTFYTNITFSQAGVKMDVLYGILVFLGVVNVVTISTRLIQSKTTHKTHVSKSFTFAFSSKPGQALLNAWAQQPPRCPSKCLDYNVAMLLTQLSKKSADKVINDYLNCNAVSDKRIAELACLWLRSKMSGVERGVRNKKPIDDFYAELKVTLEEKELSVKLGELVFKKLQQVVDSQTAKLQTRLTDDYIVGYHIGDGGFTLQTTITKEGSLKISFGWTITDAVQNKALLEAIKNFLVAKGCDKSLNVTGSAQTFKILRLTGRSNMSFFNCWANVKFPEYRQNQYNKFFRALEICRTPNFRNNLTLLEELINIKWSMNAETNYKKKSHLQSDLNQICNWYHFRQN